MAYSEVVEEQGKFRAIIEVDESPSEPDWDGQAAVLSLNTQHYSYDVEAKNSAGEGFDDALRRFYETTGDAMETFERYLRIFHGTKAFSVIEADYRSTDYTYIAFDTAKLREEWGNTDAFLDQLEAEGKLDTLCKTDLDAWYAWATGDVWGVRVERSTGFVKTWEDGSVEDGREWVTVEDTEVWGYYGQDDAEEQAREALRIEVEAEAKTK
jgi:hypothetical protein